jgi:4-hydroxybenzoyl-CoA thioesterase
MKRARNRVRSAVALALPRRGGGGQNLRVSAAAPPPRPFVHRQAIRFSHCDPGGIVYFPHYFEMVYEAIEDWFDAEIEPNLETRLRQEGIGFPTVNTQCDFFRPSRVGDALDLEITVARLGRSAVEFLVAGKVAGEARMRFRHLIALVSLERLRAAPIPEPLRTRIAPHVAGGGGLARLPEPPAGVARPFPTEYLIRFSHCDPGGIVHFPRYFDMINAAVEDWFAQALALPFDTMHMDRRFGFPIVHTQCEFLRPCRIGERLVLELTVARIGRASLDLTLCGRIGGEERLRARNVRSMMSLETYRALPIPDDLRSAMAPFVAGTPA